VDAKRQTYLQVDVCASGDPSPRQWSIRRGTRRSAIRIVETRLEDTSHYQITRGILECPERYWKHLRAAVDEP
jgi:hypothetical protein